MRAFVVSFLIVVSLQSQASVDCSEAYGKPATCEAVACNEKQSSFLGTWSGPFEMYSEEFSTPDKAVYRPFQNTVTYSAKDCLRNAATGEIFIIGRRTDTYPEFRGLTAQVKRGLMITGTNPDGSPFLRTIDDDGNSPYRLEYKNDLAVLAIWKRTIPAGKGSPEYRFVTIDGRDFTDPLHHKRNVIVTISIGPVEKPFWEGVLVKGTHTLQN